MLPPLPDGTILRQRYKLTNVVGQGGMGSIYRAEDLRLPGRLCAIKEVQPDPTAPAELRAQAQEQFLREASILAQLDHPNLPKVSDFFTHDGRDFLVMDYVPGQDLRQIIEERLREDKVIEERLVLNWAVQILDALAYLHQQDPPVLHRDIKPANIKLTPNNRIKLVDFGLAKLLAGDEARTITVIQGRGTALYTPLEQYAGESDHTDVRSDIYSIGATLYHLLTLSPPPAARERFRNPNVLRPPHQLNDTVTANVSDAVMWALEMHPDDRPDNVSLFSQTLLGQITRPPRRQSAPPRPNLMDALRANQAIAFIVLILLALALFLTFS
jgi:serine/threonine-protein kinase